jgi:holliday junction DNA helicase RuvA
LLKLFFCALLTKKSVAQKRVKGKTMINTVQGTITDIKEQCITVDIGNLGLAVFVATTISFHVGQQINLTTHLHWNADQGPSLYGFADSFEKTVFLLLTSCTGVGPKLALAALGYLGAQGFLEAINSGNDKALSKVPGIGAKKAEQIIVHLKHKVNALIVEHPITAGSSLQLWQEVGQALESLNYSRQEINQAMNHLAKKTDGSSLPFDQLLRQALGFLAKK